MSSRALIFLLHQPNWKGDPPSLKLRWRLGNDKLSLQRILPCKLDNLKVKRIYMSPTPESGNREDQTYNYTRIWPKIAPRKSLARMIIQNSDPQLMVQIQSRRKKERPEGKLIYAKHQPTERTTISSILSMKSTRIQSSWHAKRLNCTFYRISKLYFSV